MIVNARQISTAIPAAAIALYLLLPSAAASPFGSWPLTPPGAAVFAIAISVAFLATRVHSARVPGRLTAVVVLLMVARVVLATMAVDEGWLARYYTNESWSGQPEWSSDFRWTDATRIDRTLTFEAGTLPIHFLNGAEFSKGNEREITQPLTIDWSGVFSVADATPMEVEVTANGEASVLVDGTEVASTSAAATLRTNLGAGSHHAVVRYRKPAGTAGALVVSMRHAGTRDTLRVYPAGVNPRSRPIVDGFAVAIDAIALLTLLVITAMTLRSAWRSAYRVQAVVGAAVLIVLGVQGYVTALPNAYQFRTLTGGDDWLGFESRARDVLQNGLLMTLGKPLGEGAAYFYHPFYSYVLAGVHLVAGESLFAPVFVHFLILAVTALLLWSFASGLFGRIAATCGLAALIVVFEVDFVRYYTITLLSENLYVLTVTICLMAFARWATTGRVAALIQAGAWAGISAATRPAMMMFLFPALAVTVAIAFRHRRGWWPWQAACIAGASWMAVLLPFTIRNWIVARRLVLISDGLGGGFIEHGVPPGIDAAPYLNSYTGGIGNSLVVLWRVVIEHPVAVASLQLQKLGFSLGMVHWFDGFRPHPELAAITLLYLLMIVLSPVMRRPEVWPIHAFVVSHVASMALTSPWNYGYRLILPPFVYTTTLSVAAASAMLMNVQARRAARL